MLRALSRFALVVCEATEGSTLMAPTLPHEPALKAHATHGAIADTALRKLRIGAEVATDDGAVRDKLLEALRLQELQGEAPAWSMQY